MKNLKSKFALLLLATGLSLTSCSSEDSSVPHEDPQTGELRLFLIDTARINTIKPDGSGETTILDKYTDQNSYIGAMSISPNGEKLIYSESQWVSGSSRKQLRIAKTDGTGDNLLYQATEAQTNIQMMRFIENDKVCFVTVNYMTNTRIINTVKSDGSGLESTPTNYDISDISRDRRYLVTNISAGAGASNIRVIDRNGDNGAGGLYHLEAIDSNVISISDAIFTMNDSKLVFAYLQDTTVKVRIINMQTKTSETFDLLSNQSSSTLSLSLSVGADNDRAVLTISDFNTSAPSVSHLFKISDGSVSGTFTNNDDNVFDVYAW
jgi:hypothetical protein